MTRRDFLGFAAVVAATGSALRLCLSASCHCGAKFRSPHSFGERAYCPNCGRDVVENQFRLVREGKARANPTSGSWDPAQVPFPNPLLVDVTDKPAMLLAKIRLQGMLDLSSA
jgi:hypothetical protein